MNKKQKIIVSVVGITIVLLTLLGLTYAYFLTRIQGTTNNKSISVTTANLELTYGDNSAEILGKDLTLIPSDTEIGTKTFTVTNNGNDTNYVVVIENVSVTKASDVSTTTFNSNDFRYTLTCTKKDGTSCDGVSTQSVFPINGGVLVGNSIKEGDVHTYTFKMWYIDTGIDQSNDMGKHLQARLNITNIESMTNPYSANTNSLAYNIIENAKNKTNGTELLSSPKTQVAVEGSIYTNNKYGIVKITSIPEYLHDSRENPLFIADTETSDGTYAPLNGCTSSSIGKYVYFLGGESQRTKVMDCIDGEFAIYGKIYENESSIVATQDDYGISYYYRGNIIDNYVNFAGMCWRGVRIAGDGSIKLVLEDQDSTCATSDGNWDIPTETGGTIKTGNFGYTQHAANTLTASDGTKNSKDLFLMNYLNGGTNNDKSMATAFKNFQTGPLANYLDKLKAGDWCLNDKAYATMSDNTTALTNQEILDKQIKGTTFYYDSSVRLDGKTTKEPTLKCNGTNMSKFADNTDMYVGTLTMDEIVYAGGKTSDTNRTTNHNYYLIDGSNTLNFLTLSPSYFGGGIYDGSYGDYTFSSAIVYDYPIRPAVSLKSNVQITGGNGTKANAYEIAS